MNKTTKLHENISLSLFATDNG